MSTVQRFAMWGIVLAFLSCGGGGSPNIPLPPGDVVDSGEQEVVSKDANDISGDKGAPDVKEDLPTDNQPEGEDITIQDDGVSSDGFDADLAGDVEVSKDLPGDNQFDGEVTVFSYTCDHNDNRHPVCGLDHKTTYDNTICAICDECANVKGYGACPCCSGTVKNCDWDDDTTFLSQKAPCNTCQCKLGEDKTGPVCGACTAGDKKGCGDIMGLGSAQTYENLCDFRQGVFGKYGECSDDPTTSTHFFNEGACKFSVCAPCENKPNDPVCGADGNTYPNKCWLNACPANGPTKKVCGAPCLDTQKCPNCAGTKCADVCASVKFNGHTISKTFFNECEAQCNGATVRYHMHCASCQGQPYKPSCVKDTDGKAVTLLSECELSNTGLPKLYDGPCKCDCDQGDCKCSCDDQGNCKCDCNGATGGVCGGQYGNTWPSECWLTCLGLTKLHDGVCTHECEKCDAKFAPVCARGQDNKIYTYPSDCFAKCKGATKLSDGVCNDCKTLCGTPDHPVDPIHQVCGADGVTYPTACFPEKCMHETYKEGACGE